MPWLENGRSKGVNKVTHHGRVKILNTDIRAPLVATLLHGKVIYQLQRMLVRLQEYRYSSSFPRRGADYPTHGVTIFIYLFVYYVEGLFYP